MRLRRVKQNRKSVFFDPLKRGKNAEKLRCGFTDGCIPIFYKFGIYKKVSTLPLLMSWSARGYSNNQLRHHSNRCYYHSYGCHYLPKVLAVVLHAHFFVCLVALIHVCVYNAVICYYFVICGSPLYRLHHHVNEVRLLEWVLHTFH